MKRTALAALALMGFLALLSACAAVRAADDNGRPFGPPCGGPPPVPPFFADKYDANHDGKLTDAEEKTARDAFLKLYDKDNDGRLSPQELDAVRADEGKAVFSEADADHDGKLTLEEFNTAWSKFPMMGPGGPKGHHRGPFAGDGGRPCDK